MSEGHSHDELLRAGTLANNEIVQLLNEIPVTMRSTDTVACRLPVVYKCVPHACMHACAVASCTELTIYTGSACRDELLTNCKQGTGYSSSTSWCFTTGANKRRQCTSEEGATRPLSWFFAASMVRIHAAEEWACMPSCADMQRVFWGVGVGLAVLDRPWWHTRGAHPHPSAAVSGPLLAW